MNYKIKINGAPTAYLATSAGAYGWLRLYARTLRRHGSPLNHLVEVFELSGGQWLLSERLVLSDLAPSH